MTRPMINVMNMKIVCNEIFDFIGDRVKVMEFVEVALKKTLKQVKSKYPLIEERSTINSITRFESPACIPIMVGNPKVAKTKGSGKGGMPSKHSERFNSRRESCVPKARTCSICHGKGHNKRGCTTQE